MNRELWGYNVCKEEKRYTASPFVIDTCAVARTEEWDERATKKSRVGISILLHPCERRWKLQDVHLDEPSTSESRTRATGLSRV